jgi:hypothetical protein
VRTENSGRFPEELLQNLPPARTLRQGRQTVSDQFAYSFEISPDGEFARILATFRYSFAVAAFIAPSLEFFEDPSVRPIQRGQLLILDARPK